MTEDTQTPEQQPAPAPAKPRKRKAKPAPVAPGAKVHKGPVPKPLKGERSGQFIRRVITNGLWGGTDRALAELMVSKYYPDHVTTEKDVAWNRWDMKRKAKRKS